MLKVNLFDFNFRQADCSVAYQSSKHVEYVRDWHKFDGITLFTDGYAVDGTVNWVESQKKIAWLREPQCLHPANYERISEFEDVFDRILTYYAPLLGGKYKDKGKYRFVPYGGIWIPEKEWHIKRKSKLCSMLYGEKRTAPGHLLRHEVGDFIAWEFPDLVDFYGVRGEKTTYGPKTKMKVHGDYMFSVVIETCQDDNLFTEILLDCMIIGTVPIFWGAGNISAFFNPYGILQFSGPGFVELREILQELSPALYQSMLPAVQDNFQKAQQYRVTEDWMHEHGIFEF